MLLDNIIKKYLPKLELLKNISQENELDIQQINNLEAQLKKNFFDIAFIGEFTAGKSSIINALLNLDILPTDLGPSTAKITYISFAEHPSILIHYKNGEDKSFELDITHNLILKELVATNKEEVDKISTIELFLNNNLLKDGVRLIDTPGTNDTDEERVKLTYALLPQVDAVCYVTIHPITESNLEVFRKHILGNSISNVIFILNKIDLKKEHFDEVIEDTKNNFERICGYEISEIYNISAIDYIEGKGDNDFELIKNSCFLSFQEGLFNFLTEGERYQNLELQYARKIKSIALEANSLLEIKISSLSMPDDIFEEKKKSLENELNQHTEQAKRLSLDTETEITQLINKLESSLNKLLEEILTAVDTTLSINEGSTDLLIKQIEQGIKNKYDFWKEKNETVIKGYIETIVEEVNIRLGTVIKNINLSIEKYNGHSTAVAYSVNSNVPSLLSDDKKASAAISIASAGTYALLAMLHITMAPLAILMAPIGFYLFHKKKAEERLALKPQIMQKVQESNSDFKRETLREIYQVKKGLVDEIDSTISAFAIKIKKQIVDVEIQRDQMKDNIDKQIEAVNNYCDKIKVNFINE